MAKSDGPDDEEGSNPEPGAQSVVEPRGESGVGDAAVLRMQDDAGAVGEVEV